MIRISLLYVSSLLVLSRCAAVIFRGGAVKDVFQGGQEEG